MASFLDQLDTIPEPVMLALNAAMGGFVLLAHGGALLMVLSGRVPVSPEYAATVHATARITLPLAALLVAGSIFAFFSRGARGPVLFLQAIVLFASGLAMVGWAVGLVVNGIPKGNFGWTPGFLTGWVAYSTFLCSRFAVPRRWKDFPVVKYSPIICAVAALPVDLGVMVRFVSGMARR